MNNFTTEKMELELRLLNEVRTYIAEVFVEQFNISVDNLQQQQFVVISVRTTTEIQAGIPVSQSTKRTNI